MENNGYTIKQARIIRGFTQQDMAIKLGMSLPNYRFKEENPGRFRVDELMSFLDAVGLNKEDLLFLRKNYANVSNENTQKG